MTLTDHIIGKRTYELTNHLGNVLSTVSDKIIPEERTNTPLVSQDFSSSYTPFVTDGTITPSLVSGEFKAAGASMWNNVYVVLATEPGVTYNFSFDVNLSGGGSIYPFVHDPGTATNIAGMPVTTNGSYTINVTAIGTTTYFLFSNNSVTSPRDFYLDNVVIERDLGEEALYFLADIRTAQDYSPFGVTLEGRNFVLSGAEKSRYGFQGQERDDEIKGEGNSWNYKYRMHDPRLGRFFAIDPLATDYPYNSPYAFSENCVINAVELEGLEKVPADELWDLNGANTTVSVITWENVNYNLGRYAKLKENNLLCFPITSGPNKGNWVGYVANNQYEISKIYNYQLKGKFYTDPPKMDYVIGSDRAPDKAHNGDLGTIAVGSLIEASSDRYDMSWTLADVKYTNNHGVGHYSKTTAEWIPGTYGELMARVGQEWWQQVSDPMSYVPGPDIKLKVGVDLPSSPLQWNKFQKFNRGKYNSSNISTRSSDYDKWLKEGFEADYAPVEAPNPSDANFEKKENE